MNQYGTHVFFGWKWWTWRICWPLAKMNKSFFWFCWSLNHLFAKALYWRGCDCHSCHSIAWYAESLRSKWRLLSKSMAKPIAVLVAPFMNKCTCLELLETTKKNHFEDIQVLSPRRIKVQFIGVLKFDKVSSWLASCQAAGNQSKTSSRFLGTGLKNLSWLNTEMEHPEFVPIWTISKGFSKSCPEVSACWMFHLADKSCLCQNAGQSRQSDLEWKISAAGQNFGAAGQNFGRVAALCRSNSCNFAFSPLEYMKDLILLMLFDRRTWSVPFFSVAFLGRPNLVTWQWAIALPKSAVSCRTCWKPVYLPARKAKRRWRDRECRWCHRPPRLESQYFMLLGWSRGDFVIPRI